MKEVSQSFKKCFELNQEKTMKSRPRLVDENAHYFAPDVSFDSSINQTFVVHPEYEPLSESAEQPGNTIVSTDLLGCINQLRSGDRIYIQSGCYEMTRKLRICDKDVQIIGLGEEVQIQFVCPNKYLDNIYIRGKSKVLIQNIIIRGGDAGITLKGESVLWMENCNIEGYQDRAIGIYSNSPSHFKSCKFLTHNTCDYDIHIGKKHDEIVNIIGCSFGNSGCCVSTKAPIRCVGNFFVNNYQAIEYDTLAPDKCILVGNVYQEIRDVTSNGVDFDSDLSSESESESESDTVSDSDLDS